MLTHAQVVTMLGESYQEIAQRIPNPPADAQDAFMLHILHRFGAANRGSGFEAIQAEHKLKAMKDMTYEALRAAAVLSPEYADFAQEYANAGRKKPSPSTGIGL